MKQNKRNETRKKKRQFKRREEREHNHKRREGEKERKRENKEDKEILIKVVDFMLTISILGNDKITRLFGLFVFRLCQSRI